ncbi:hypothetical protein [Bradyrhizobium sp. AUGA SZCCT0160]|uniref:hypothetical protein n=1 Tax=Bradyrhizobium sp. AUGA SZCCT0160 TaxID=2807662 RepID=UPI001BA58976|nr:hypothetical protein [Bradyrhizobium sp. AUGA SZCCT0160]MBR1187409.1 hypothetical protein [Bradyrhizobium sp. AUGA SZCCT0160]
MFWIYYSAQIFRVDAELTKRARPPIVVLETHLTEHEILRFGGVQNAAVVTKQHTANCFGGTEHRSKMTPCRGVRNFCLEQIARAKRFAAAMNTEADKERFEQMAADYQSELDAAEAAPAQPSALVAASEEAAEDAAVAERQTGGSDATSQATAGSEDEQKPTTDWSAGQPNGPGHMKAMTRPIPTSVYRPVTVMPRRTSAITPSEGRLMVRAGIPLLRSLVLPELITPCAGFRSDPNRRVLKMGTKGVHRRRLPADESSIAVRSPSLFA